MKFQSDIIPFLKGQQFSNGITIPTTFGNELIQSRLDFLVKQCTGKRIVHLGCADHIEIIDEKLKKNNWLHKLLVEKSAKCIGIDNNEEALAHIRQLGYKEVYHADITNNPPLNFITSGKWDYLVMGEIIEHIGNPVAFLDALRVRYAPYIDRIILTTPHAFRFKNFTRAARKNSEIINSDHRFWFTPYTLAKISIDAGLWPEEFWFVENMKPTSNALFKKWLLKKYPAFRDTIIMSCRLKP